MCHEIQDTHAKKRRAFRPVNHKQPGGILQAMYHEIQAAYKKTAGIPSCKPQRYARYFAGNVLGGPSSNNKNAGIYVLSPTWTEQGFCEVTNNSTQMLGSEAIQTLSVQLFK